MKLKHLIVGGCVKILRPILYFLLCVGLLSCGSVKQMSVLCNLSEIEIYIDGNYIGKGLVNYTVPQGANVIEVSCRQNGKEITKRIVPVKNNTLYEIYLSDEYQYSTSPIIYKSK